MKTFLALATALTLVSGASFAQEKIVNVYNWSDYIAPDTVEKFTAETGIKVRYDVFDSNEILEAKLLTGSSGYDVVVPSIEFMARQLKAGVFKPIDKSALSNYSNLDPSVLRQLAVNDPGNKFGVPYMMFTVGIGYDAKKIAARLKPEDVGSWAMVFKPENAAKLADCGIAVLDSPSEVTAAALIYLGIDPLSEKPEDLTKATKLIQSIRPYIRYFHSSQYINDLANGDICLVIGYSGDMIQARKRAEEAKKGPSDIAYAIPREGTQMGFDMLAIPVDAPHAANALKFINFILKPQIAADISNEVFYANPNLAADGLVNPEVKNNPGIYPTSEVRSKLFLAKPHTQQYDRKLTRAWTTIKTGQ